MNWITWALLSAFFAGITAVLAKIGVAGVDSNLATAVRTTVVLVFTWGIALATSPVASLRQLSSRTLMFLALSGIATGLSWLCYFRALQLGQASRVAPVDKLSVVFAIVACGSRAGRAVELAALRRRRFHRDRRNDTGAGLIFLEYEKRTEWENRPRYRRQPWHRSRGGGGAGQSRSERGCELQPPGG